MKTVMQTKTVNISLELHALLKEIRAKKGMLIHGIIDAAVKDYAKKFFPELFHGDNTKV